METVKYFKAKENTKRFKKGQIIWVKLEASNYLQVFSKWRGTGRFTQSTINKWDFTNKKINWNKIVGENGLSEMEVSEKFIKRIYS